MLEDQDTLQQYHLAQAPGWSVSHRTDSALPGYLIVTSAKVTSDLGDLSAEALGSMGSVLAKVQRALNGLGAKRVYIGRYGHSPGHPLHFHVIPIYDWVEELFLER